MITTFRYHGIGHIYVQQRLINLLSGGIVKEPKVFLQWKELIRYAAIQFISIRCALLGKHFLFFQYTYTLLCLLWQNRWRCIYESSLRLLIAQNGKKRTERKNGNRIRAHALTALQLFGEIISIKLSTNTGWNFKRRISINSNMPVCVQDFQLQKQISQQFSRK